MKPNTRNVRDLDFEISVNFEVAFRCFDSCGENIFCFQGELCSVKEFNKYKMR